MIPSLKKERSFILAGLIALVTLSPVLFILVSGFQADHEIWTHLRQYVLPGLLKNTAVLVAGVIFTTALLGVSLAWLTSFYEFAGRRWFERLLLLPLAIPAYVMAFIYTGLLDFSGPVQTFLREYLPGLAPAFPEIRSAWGVIMVISLAIFPYVFLMASSGFRSMGRSMIEASQSLNAGRMFTLFRVTIPMARPWIFGGLILVFMETLADFGAVSVFNYDTFTTGVYKAWYGFFSINSASQLASILVVIVLVIFLAESYFRRKQQFFNTGHHRSMPRTQLNRKHTVLAVGYCCLILCLAFVIPVAQLAAWTLESFGIEMGSHYIRLLANTFALGGMGTCFTMIVAVILAYAGRTTRDMKTGMAAKMSLSGYALPGTVLAVGMINVIAWVDNGLVASLNFAGFGITSGILKGSLFLLPLCYMIRFLTAGYNPVHSNMTRLTPSMDEAARLMKVKGLGLLTKVHLPLIRRGIITGSILVLVEIIKEMPVTLMLRPFGWDTLAVKIFELTSEGEWERAALPALTLVIAGMIPIVFLSLVRKDNN
jgi:iron(III) transport system permease protein